MNKEKRDMKIWEAHKFQPSDVCPFCEGTLVLQKTRNLWSLLRIRDYLVCSNAPACPFEVRYRGA